MAFPAERLPSPLILASLVLLTFLLMPGPARALVGTNPPSGNPGDYGGSGDWEGSDQDDQLTNEVGAQVYGYIDGRLGSDHIINRGTTTSSIYGSMNQNDGDSSGGNTVENSGTLRNGDIYGTVNAWVHTSGGNNTIINSGTVTGALVGTQNVMTGTSGGGNTIINSGTVGDSLCGSDNGVAKTSGGNNTIINSGTVEWEIYGSANDWDSSGGNNTIKNSGTVKDSIYGSYNDAFSHASGGNTIENSGTVHGDIFGSYEDPDAQGIPAGNTITNRGVVKGSIYGGRGDDTVIVAGGSSVGGVVDGEDGDDTLGLEGMGTVDSGLWGSHYLNFENLSIQNGDNTLTGIWSLGGGLVTVRSGSLTLTQDTSLSAGKVTVSSGFLSLTQDASLSASELRINSGGRADILGRAQAGNTWAGGVLNVSGTLTSPSVEVASGGELQGNGTINGDVAMYGILAPGNSTGLLSVVGSYTHYPGAVYICQLNADGGHDSLDVTGPVSLRGGTLSLDLARGLYPDGYGWQVISATGGVSGAFASLVGQPDSQTLSLRQDAASDGFSVEIQRKPYLDFATSPGGREVGALLDSLVTPARQNNLPIGSLMVKMDFDMDAGQIGQMLDALDPDMYTAYGQAALRAGRLFDQSLVLRLAGQGEGQPGPGGWSLWARGLGLWADQDDEDGFLGYGQSTTGLAAGADLPIAGWLRAGLAAGYTRSDLSWSKGDYSGDGEAVHTGIYGQADLAWGYVRGLISYARFQNHGQRTLASPDFHATGDFDSDLYGLGLETGASRDLAGWIIEPLAGLSLHHVDQEGFSEKGSDFVGLTVDEYRHDWLASRLGARAGRGFTTGEMEWRPRLGLFWQHEFDSGRPQLEAAYSQYSADGLVMQGAGLPADSALIEAGLSLKSASGISGFADYNLGLGSGYTGHALTLGMRIEF